MFIECVISGGQTGVDRAALDAARACGVPAGGWCPKGRRAEDGVIPDRYPLKETPSTAYAQRTAWNARDSSGTLILLLENSPGASEGTALTVEEARRRGKPCRIVHLPAAPADTRGWIIAHEIRTLNVAGPRASEAPGVYRAAHAFLEVLLSDAVS